MRKSRIFIGIIIILIIDKIGLRHKHPRLYKNFLLHSDIYVKIYVALMFHKSEFCTKDMHWQSLTMRDIRRERYGFYELDDKGKYYNF